jgi:hypothetical protein
MSELIQMNDGGTYDLRRLLSGANHKQRKGAGYLSAGLTMTPRATGRSGENLCPNATKGCARSCFAGYDRMAWPQNKRAAVARTLLLAADPSAFLAMLCREIALLQARAGVPHRARRHGHGLRGARHQARPHRRDQGDARRTRLRRGLRRPLHR